MIKMLATKSDSNLNQMAHNTNPTAVSKGLIAFAFIREVYFVSSFSHRTSSCGTKNKVKVQENVIQCSLHKTRKNNYRTLSPYH